MTNPPGLYAALMGPAWAEVDAAVRSLHEPAVGAVAEGFFTVRWGHSTAARLAAFLLRLPQPGAQVAVRLELVSRGAAWRWTRIFAGRRLVTEQYLGGEDLLAERFGALEFGFALRAEGGALVYEQRMAALVAGPLRLRLPRRLAPRIAGRARRGPDDRSVAVAVRVEAPIVGVVLEYEGEVREAGAPR